MASNKIFTPRDSPLAFGAHLLLTLLTLCLFFEILRLATFTSAIPTRRLAHHREDSGGPNDPRIYRGSVEPSIASSENSKRNPDVDFGATFDDLGSTINSIVHPNMSSSENSERDVGEDVHNTISDFGATISRFFGSDDKHKTPVDFVSEYAYDKLHHHISLEDLKKSFKKNYDAMTHSKNHTSDETWEIDQIDNVIPQLKKKYDEAEKKDSDSKHHERDTSDKLRPKRGDDDYYTGPHFFPYPMPRTPAISDELKSSLADAFNEWQANATNDANSTCSAACYKADAITTKVDYTPKDKRKEIVEACIQSLIDDPSCLGQYQSTNVLKPYLTELVDKGKIKDEDGVIKKFYKRTVILEGDAGTVESAKPIGSISADQKRSIPVHLIEPIPDASNGSLVPLPQNFKDVLAKAFKKYKEDLTNHSDMSCPLTKENSCENPNLGLAAQPDATNPEEHQQMLELCIVFLGWHPNCLLRYETKDFIKPYLDDLAGSK